MEFGSYIAILGAVSSLVKLNGITAVTSIAQALPMIVGALPGLGIAAIGNTALTLGIKGIINTYKGNRNTEIVQDIKDVKKEVKRLTEALGVNHEQEHSVNNPARQEKFKNKKTKEKTNDEIEI